MPLYQRLFNPGISSDLVNVALNNERQVDGGRIVRNKTFMSATVGKKKNKGIIHSARQGWYCSFVRPTIYKRTGHLERYSSIGMSCATIIGCKDTATCWLPRYNHRWPPPQYIRMPSAKGRHWLQSLEELHKTSQPPLPSP